MIESPGVNCTYHHTLERVPVSLATLHVTRVVRAGSDTGSETVRTSSWRSTRKAALPGVDGTS